MSNKKSAQVPETPKAENKNMSKSIIEQAKEKIKTPITGKLNQKAGAINKPTAAAMELFCEQSEEFARAIVECDKTFSDCLNAIVKDIGNAVSDFDVYSKAVEFFFPGAKVEFKMLIHMSEYDMNESQETIPKIQESSNISLSLDSLLDW